MDDSMSLLCRTLVLPMSKDSGALVVVPVGHVAEWIGFVLAAGGEFLLLDVLLYRGIALLEVLPVGG